MAALAKVEKIDVRRIARAVKNHEKLDDLRPLGPIINVSPVRARINKRHEDWDDPITYRPPHHQGW